MSVKKRYLFILIGDDKTGKTTFQKILINKLHGIQYEKLPRHQTYEVKDDILGRDYTRASYGNRSYQEKSLEYGSVENYMHNFFQAADIALIASHLNISDIEKMIHLGKEKFYNVIGVFFSNSIALNPSTNAQISALNWDERLIIENPHATGVAIDKQLEENADSFIQVLINRTNKI